MNCKKRSAYFMSALAVMLLCAPRGYSQDKTRAGGSVPAPNEESLKSLAQCAPEYKDYQVQVVPLPLTTPDASIKVVSRLKWFAGTGGPESGGIRITEQLSVGMVSLDSQKKEEAAKLFNQTVTTGICTKMASNPISRYCLLVVSGEGGGLITGGGAQWRRSSILTSGKVGGIGGTVMGGSGYITAEVFLLDTRTKALVAYSDDPIGKGNDVDAAVKDLANAVAKKFSEIAIQAK